MPNATTPPIDLKLAATIVNRTASAEQLRLALVELGYTVDSRTRYEVWSPDKDHFRDGPVMVPLDQDREDYALLLDRLCSTIAPLLGARHFSALVTWAAARE